MKIEIKITDNSGQIFTKEVNPDSITMKSIEIECQRFQDITKCSDYGRSILGQGMLMMRSIFLPQNYE